MPILFAEDGGPRAVFDGRCTPEEADGLLDWLRRTPEPEADLAACTDVHTALAQLLMAARVRLVAPPADCLLAACLGAALPAAAGKPAAATQSTATGKPVAATQSTAGTTSAALSPENAPAAPSPLMGETAPASSNPAAITAKPKPQRRAIKLARKTPHETRFHC